MLKIRPAQQNDLPRLKEFTDRAIGTNYYSPEELQDILRKSESRGVQYTLVLIDDEAADQIYGVRITFPPGQWQKGKGRGLSPTLWKVPLSETAYFQSLFIDPAMTGRGLGQKLSLEAIKMLKEAGTRAIVCHSWKESPNDSSGRYLRGLGFEVVATHPLYWKDVDYVCTRCGKPCLCTAEEMIKYL